MGYDPNYDVIGPPGVNDPYKRDSGKVQADKMIEMMDQVRRDCGGLIRKYGIDEMWACAMIAAQMIKLGK